MMKKKITLLFLLVSVAAHAANPPQPNKVLPLTPAQLQHMQVQWGSLQPAESGLSATYPAEVVLPPTQTRAVTPAQSGLITRLDVAVGDQVRQGQVIGQLSSPDLVSLQSSYLQAETQARLHAQALKRDEELYKDGIIAQRRMQETQSAYETSQAMLGEHKQTLRLAGMSETQVQQLAQKRSMQSGMAIIAPISGQVMAQHQQVGARVDMATPILTISNPNPLWLMIQVPVAQARALQPGMQVSVPKLGLQARIDTVLRQLNKDSQSTQVRASVHQGAELLSVGQVVDVALMRGGEQLQQPGRTSYSVPRSAVVRQGEQAVLFVQQPKGVSVLPVSIVLEHGQSLTISGDLHGDERIATRGAAALKGHWVGLGGE